MRMRPGSAPYSEAICSASTVHDASTASEHSMMDASASARRCGMSASTSSGIASALTRSRVWKVHTSGRFSSCLMPWPARPDSQ